MVYTSLMPYQKHGVISIQVFFNMRLKIMTCVAHFVASDTEKNLTSITIHYMPPCSLRAPSVIGAMGVTSLFLCITYFSLCAHMCSWHTMELNFLA